MVFGKFFEEILSRPPRSQSLKTGQSFELNILELLYYVIMSFASMLKLFYIDLTPKQELILIAVLAILSIIIFYRG